MSNEELCERWIVEYDSYMRLIRLISKIVDAKDRTIAECCVENQGDVSPVTTTPLEEAVDLVDYIHNTLPARLDSDELREVQLCLRRYAVLAPLCIEDDTTAKV